MFKQFVKLWSLSPYVSPDHPVKYIPRVQAEAACVWNNLCLMKTKTSVYDLLCCVHAPNYANNSSHEIWKLWIYFWIYANWVFPCLNGFRQAFMKAIISLRRRWKISWQTCSSPWRIIAWHKYVTSAETRAWQPTVELSSKVEVYVDFFRDAQKREKQQKVSRDRSP